MIHKLSVPANVILPVHPHRFPTPPPPKKKRPHPTLSQSASILSHRHAGPSPRAAYDVGFPFRSVPSPQAQATHFHVGPTRPVPLTPGPRRTPLCHVGPTRPMPLSHCAWGPHVAFRALPAGACHDPFTSLRVGPTRVSASGAHTPLLSATQPVSLCKEREKNTRQKGGKKGKEREKKRKAREGGRGVGGSGAGEAR